jgi:gas vesicle protein
MPENDRGNGFISGLFFGGLVGAALVFLFGTKEGRKIKDQLTEKGKELINDLPQVVEDLEKQGQEFAQKAEEVKKALEEKAKEFTPLAKEKIATSLSSIEEAQRRGRETAAKIRKRFFTKKGRKLG